MRRRAAAAIGSLIIALAACGEEGGSPGDGGDGGDGGPLVFWSAEDNTERIEATQTIIDRFTEETNIEVELVAVAEDQLATRITSAIAADTLPDVFGALSLGFTHSLQADGVADTAAAEAVVESLGRDTFSESALELVTNPDGELIGVPSDSWTQLLVYRRDLFEDAGLEPPTTYDTILAAAEELNGDDQAGIVLATGNDLGFVQQTFEYFAVANDCDVTDDAGNVAIDSSQCQETFQFYTDLVANSVTGAQDADTTRAAYFAGDAAMIVWSSFLLDELAGLRDDALPTCGECADDPLFLAENSGVVTAIQGPSASEPSQFGELVSFVISEGASEDAQQFVEFMMSDGYVDWLALAPEGKFPVRLGTADNPTEYADAWGTLEAGVDRKEPLGEIYDADTIEALTTSSETMKRWAFAQGLGALAGALLTEGTVPNALIPALDGSVSPEEAAQEAQAAVEELLGGLD